MSLTDLANKLRAEAASGSITINAANLTQGTGLTLRAGFDLDQTVRDSFRLDAGQNWKVALTPQDIKDPVGNTLRVDNGKSSFAGLTLTDAGVSIEFTVTESGGQTILNFTSPIKLGDWKFSSTFTYMTGYPYEYLPYGDPYFVFATDKILAYPWNTKSIALEIGQNFASLTTLTGVFEGVLQFLTGYPGGPLAFYGPMQVKDINKAPTLLPQFVLTAPIPAIIQPILSLSIQNPFVGMRVANIEVKGDDGKTTIQQLRNFYFGMRLAIGEDTKIELDFITKIFRGGTRYNLYVASSPQKPMTPEALFELMAGESWTALIPAQLQQFLSLIAFQDLSVDLAFVNSKPVINSIAATVGSTSEWHLFGDFTIKQFTVAWQIDGPGVDNAQTIEFYARFEFFKELFKDDFVINITSDLVITGGYEGEVKFSDLVRVISGGSIQLPDNKATFDFGFQNFQVFLDFRQKRYVLSAEAFLSLDIMGTSVIELYDVSFQITALPKPGTTETQYLGMIEGTLYFLDVGIYLSAEYQGEADGWYFEGALAPDEELALGELLNKLLAAVKLPEFLPASLIVQELAMTASPATSTKKSSSYSGSGKLQLIDTDLGFLGQFTLVASLNVEYTNDGKTGGKSTGEFAFITTIEAIGAEFTIGYRFNPEGNNVLFLLWEVFTVEYNTKATEILFKIDGWTFGDLLVSFVRMITGDYDFRLPSPWDLLNQISLKGFQVKFNLTTKEVSFEYKLTNKINLGFLTINGLELKKDKNGLLLTLDATFLDGSKVPSFDPMKQTPDVPTGNALVDLKLLALGQHVTVSGINQVKNMNQAIEVLAKFHDNPPDKLPVGGPNQPAFDPNNSWLIGTHVTVLGNTLDLKVVFLDPELYGLRIALAGEKAKIFAGLQFEILYKRITDSIGVYQIELKLPDAMRYLDFGALSIILPVVGVEIYTNGNFKIDFGFPYNNDFSRSFGVQYFPFVGYGGFYFAYLNSATSTKVPKSTKGLFDPVFEFGIGLAIGLGKDINKGILKAGISITVTGILEGVLAVWKPNNSTQLAVIEVNALAAANGDVQKSYYYRIQGSIGIVGKIYGSINFAIISADLNLTVYAFIQATIEAYRPLMIYLEAGVSVSLTVKINLGIFKVKIHLSFSTKISERFELGSRSLAPWDDALLANSRALTASAYNRYSANLAFAPLSVAEDEKPSIYLYYVTQVSVEGDPNTAPQGTKAKFVAMLYIDAPKPKDQTPTPGALDAAIVKTSFETFAEEVFLWSVHAFWDQKPANGNTSRAAFAGTPILREHVTAAFKYLADNTESRPISYTDIVEGLFSQINFVIKAPGTLDSAVPFPMFPNLHLDAPAFKGAPEVSVDFIDYSMVNSDYLKALRAYFQQLVAQYQSELEKKYAGAPSPTALYRAPEEDKESFTQAVFEDYVLMVARYMLQAGVDAFDSFSYRYNGEKVSDIVQQINAISDPGSGIHNTLTAQQVVFANQTLDLTPNVTFHVTQIRYAIENQQSLGDIAARFKAEALQIVKNPYNATLGGLLQQGAILDLPNGPYTIGPDDTIDRIVAKVPVSYEALTAALLPKKDALIPLAAVIIPSSSYTTKAGDKLQSVAENYAVGYDTLAADVQDVANLFQVGSADTPTWLILPNLRVMTSNDLLADMASKYGLDNLAGMAARFLLYGLRPLVNSNISIPAGSPCALVPAGKNCSFYNLSGQQFELPSLEVGDADKWAVTLSKKQTLSWLSFDGPDSSAIALPVGKESIEWINQVLESAKKSGVQAKANVISQLPQYRDYPRRFNFTTNIPLQSASALSYPVDNRGPGFVAAPRVWSLPPGMVREIAGNTALLPLFSVRIGTAEDVTNAPSASAYGWATLLDVQVKRMRVAADSADIFPNTYEFVGADIAGIQSLEAYLTAIGARNAAPIDQIYIFTGANVAGQTPVGLEYPGTGKLTAFLVKANLSTETNPGGALRTLTLGAAATPTGILNDPIDFLRLAWEASITRSGGFYMYYSLKDGGAGLPEYLFNQSDTASISLLVVYRQPSNAVASYMNAVLTGDTIDPSASTVFAQSEGQNVNYVVPKNDSFGGILSRYHVLLTDLAAAAANIPLNLGQTPAVVLKVREIYRQVKSPNNTNPNTETLADIAKHYGVTEQAIVTANPGVNFNPLAYWTLLRIPDIDRPLDAADPLNTLAKAAAYYEVSVASLAWANVDTQGLLQPGAGFQFVDQIRDRVATLPPGNVGFHFERENPGSSDTDPAIYLQSAFNLLGFALAKNTAFNSSDEALPIGPTDEMDTFERQQTRLQRRVADADPWTYQQVLYVAKSSVTRGLPDGKPSPYDGVGTVAQLHMAWRDLFGNLISSPLTDPVIGPPQPMNDTPLRVGYTDRLLSIGQWPSVLGDYSFEKKSAKNTLSVNLAFDGSRYAKTTPPSPDNDPNEVPAWQQHTLADLETYRTIYHQINQVDAHKQPTVRFSLSTSMDAGQPHPLDGANRDKLIAMVNEAILFLENWIEPPPQPPAPPAPRTLDVEIPASTPNPLDIFELTVTIAVTRLAQQVDEAFRGAGSVEKSLTPFNPHMGKAEGQDAEETVALTQFAQLFESAYNEADIFLKVATGNSRDLAGAESRRIWVVRFRRTPVLTPPAQGIYFKVENQGLYFAPEPLSNVLLSRPDIPIHPYNPLTGVDWNKTVNTAFTAIDLDTWGSTVLAAIDLILSPQFSIPAFMVDYLDSERKGYLNLILGVKGKLADAISGTVQPILEPPPPDDNLKDARSKMQQQLLTRLENAYSVTAITQWNVRISSQYSSQAPRFYGQPVPVVESAGTDRSYVFSNAKPALTNGNSYLTSAFSSTNAEQQTSYKLDLDYKITNLEHQIGGVPGIQDYLASSWLTFIVPLVPDPSHSAGPTVDSRIGMAEIPVVLRVFPTPPSLINQMAVSREDGDLNTTTTLEKAKLYNYEFTYSKPPVAQDTIDSEVRFNLSADAPLRGTAGRSLDLFDYLGMFVAVYPSLQRSMIDILRPFPFDTDPNSDVYKRTRTVLSDFYKLIEPLPDAWKTWSAARLLHRAKLNAVPGPKTYRYDFSVQEQRDPDNARLVLTRTISAANDAVVYDPQSHSEVTLPAPWIVVVYQDKVYRMVPGPEPDTFYFENPESEYLLWDQATTVRDRLISFRGLRDQGLDAMGYQNAWSAVQIVRNRDLVRGETNPLFVYRTQQVRFASKLTPLLQVDKIIDVAKITAQQKRPLVEHLSQLFGTFFNALPIGAEQEIRLECGYSYQPDDNPILPYVTIPVFLHTPFAYQVTEMPSPFVIDTAKLIQHWFGDHAPQGQNAYFRFDLTVFPSLTDSRLPLIRLTSLLLYRADIIDL